MQLLPLFLVLVLMAADQGFKSPVASWHLSDCMVIALACGPVLAIILLLMLIVWWCERQLVRGRVPGPFIMADRAARIARILVVINHAGAVLIFGWLGVVRGAIGNMILVDELVALLPALLGLIGTWWAYYPIERRMHQALLIRRLDDGQPIHPVLSRNGFALLQVRLHLLLMLAPLLLIMGARELIENLAAWRGPEDWSVRYRDVVAFVIAAAIFMLSPLLARFMLDVEPLAPGPLRDGLMAVCQRHRVKMRELLVWKTNGSMINAAVMGLVGPLRYVLITDALLELLRMEQVRAVMAHEIGHVRRRHLPWLVGCLMACFTLAWFPVVVALWGASALGWIGRSDSESESMLIDFLMNGAPLILGLLMFGWVSRRFERQADTFAVQHLSGLGEPPGVVAPVPTLADAPNPTSHDVALTPPPALATPAPVQTVTDKTRQINSEAVNAMRGALQAIAILNTVDPNRRSWRHGSIAWRQNYLASIVGKPILGLPIDRVIRWIKLSTAIVLVVATAMTIWQSRWENSTTHVESLSALNAHKVASIRSSIEQLP